MAVKGAATKTQLMAKILEVIPNSFTPDNKEVRVDAIENGIPVQIKITLTAVKSAIVNSPEVHTINEEQFFISDEERNELVETLGELGVAF